MKAKIGLAVGLLISALSADVCTDKKVAEMIKRGLSSESIDEVCKVGSTKETIKKEDPVKYEKHIRKESSTNGLKATNKSFDGDLFLEFEAMSTDSAGLNIETTGFTVGGTLETKDHLLSAIYKPLTTKTKDISESSSDISIFKVEYGHTFVVNDITTLRPDVIYTSISAEGDSITSLMLALSAQFQYNEKGYLNMSYVLYGLRHLEGFSDNNIVIPIYNTHMHDTVPGMFTVGIKHLVFESLIMEAFYKYYNNDTLPLNTFSTVVVDVPESNLGLVLKASINKNIYTKITYESITHSINSKDVDSYRLSARFGWVN